MKIIQRDTIKNKTYREILDVETHHDHLIEKDEDGTLRWTRNYKVCEIVDKIGMENIFELFERLGANKNSELLRKMFRERGYTLFGYWELFYCETNNDIANEYTPQKIN